MSVGQSLSCVRLLVTTKTVDHKAPQDHTGSSVHGILQVRILEWLPFSLPGDLSNLGMEPEPPPLQADSLPAEPLRKPLYSFPDIAFHSFSNCYLELHLLIFAK